MVDSKPIIAYLVAMRTWLFILLLLPGMALAEIYRWVDSEGRVHFSDQPVKGATKVKLKGLTTYKAPKYRKITPARSGKKTSLADTYKVRIVKPGHKETVNDNDGNIEVEVSVEPRLMVRRGHKLVLNIDGRPIVTTTNRYKLTNIDRGTHVIAAQAFDSLGRPLSGISRVTVYLRRYSRLYNQAPPQGSLIKRAPQALKMPTLPPPPASKPGFKP